jgi:pyrroloquinoline quinone biosynthesis protein E
MREPCRSCEFREIDWGGCRCQAFAFAADAAVTDPACSKSPLHGAFVDVARHEAAEPPPELLFRNPRHGARA